MWLIPPMQASDLFELLRDGRPRTRAELAESTGLARSTVAARVDQLMALGLVAPAAAPRPAAARPSLFSMNPHARVVAGVDVGATHVRAVWPTSPAPSWARPARSSPVAQGPEVVLAWVADGQRPARHPRPHPGDLAAVGIGLPGPVEHSTGRPTNPPIMPGWDRYDVPARVQQDLDVPVLIDNDVNIMALGERHAGPSPPRTSSSSRSRPASAPASSPAASCSAAPRAPPATSATSGWPAPTTCRAAAATPAASRRSPPARRSPTRCGPPGVDARTSQDVVDLAARRRRHRHQVVRQAGRDLGEVVATLVNLINPSVLVIGGRLAGAGESLLAGIREVVYHRSLPLATEHLRIVTSRAGDEAAVLGALALAIEHVLSPDAVEAASEALAAADAAAEASGGRPDRLSAACSP